MADAQKEVNINMTSSIELASSLIDQLGKAFLELEALKVASSDAIPWKDIEGHFRELESTMKKKIEELEAKEKEFTEKETHSSMVLAEREATVMAKEQDLLLDKLQELKDAAVEAITEARANHKPEISEPANGGDAEKVSSSFDNENGTLDDAQEGKSPHKTEGDFESVVIEVNHLSELTQFCEQMDSKGLLNFITENLKCVSASWKEQLSVALGSANEPARLVLYALEGFFPPKETTQQDENYDAALHGMRRSCLVLMEALSAFLTKADISGDHYLNPINQQHAKSIANEWKPRLAGESNNDGSNDHSLEAEGFLRLLATFRIASEFDEDELCKYVLAVAHHRQATELSRSLELTLKIPGVVDALIRDGRQIEAVHFICLFQLTEFYPPVPLLKAYLKELRKHCQGNGKASIQKTYNARELEAVRAVIECIKAYNLEDEYPLEPLQRRVAQLDRSTKDDRKRSGEAVDHKPPAQKIPRSEYPRPRARGPGRGRHGPPPSATYTGHPERYPPPVPSAYSSYPVASHSQPHYAAQPQVNDQMLNYYAQVSQDDKARGSYSATAPTYGAYMQPSQQPYM